MYIHTYIYIYGYIQRSSVLWKQALVWRDFSHTSHRGMTYSYQKEELRTRFFLVQNSFFPDIEVFSF